MKTLLLLEGGAMRGNYTAGVLDVFIENDIYINDVYAVSAGLLNALNYKSRQKGRIIKINKSFCRDRRFISLRKYIRKGVLMDLDFLLNEVSNELVPFDYEEFKNNDIKITTVCTEASRETPLYKEISDVKMDANYIKGACSMPLLSRFVVVDEYKLLDGGAVDAIPIEKALDDGFEKFIIVLTRPHGYHKAKSGVDKLMAIHYKKYPNMVKLFSKKVDKYNRSLEIIDELVKNKKAIAIYPSELIKVSRAERDVEKLEEIYQLGRKDCLNILEEIKEFIKE